MQDDTGPLLASRSQRSPAKGWCEIVSVDDPSTRAPHRFSDLAGINATAQECACATGATKRCGVALEQLDIMAKLLTSNRHEVGQSSLFASMDAISVV